MTIITSDDLVEEILKYLPARSLARFKSMSKQWKSIIESAFFVHKRLVCWGSRNPNLELLVVGPTYDEYSNTITLISDSFSRDHENNGQICHLSSSSCTIPDHAVDTSNVIIRVLGSCDGLVLVSINRRIKYIYLINPKTMELRIYYPATLYTPIENHYASWPELPFLAGFGKDIITGTYKVILMYKYNLFRNNVSIKINVLDLNNGVQRDAGEFPVFFNEVSDEQTSVFVKGSLFWLIRPIMHAITPSRLVAMDLNTEKCRGISVPSWYTKYSGGMHMWSFNDHLCLSDVLQCSDLDVWSLEQEHPSEKWEKIFSFNISDICWLNANFWRLGLEAAYIRRRARGENEPPWDLLYHLCTTAYTPTLISPYQL